MSYHHSPRADGGDLIASLIVVDRVVLRSRKRTKGTVLVVVARCVVCGKPVCLVIRLYQSHYECPLRLPGIEISLDAKEGTKETVRR